MARNASKGCGALMRVAPVGLFGQPDDVVFEVAVDTARLTHGHPCGFLAAGYLAVVVAALLRCEPLRQALEKADDSSRDARKRGSCERAGGGTSTCISRTASTRRSGSLGWWMGRRRGTLDRSLLRARRQRFRRGGSAGSEPFRRQRQHVSRSGNLLGVQLGERAIPHNWLERLELRDQIAQVADDIHAAAAGGLSADADWS